MSARRDYDSMIDDLRRYVSALEWQLADRTARGRANGDPAAALAGLSSALEELRAARDEVAQARGEAEADRARYKDLFAAAPDGYLVTDTHGQIIEANLAVAHLLGVPHVYLAQKPLFVYVAVESRADYWGALREARLAGRHVALLRVTPRRGRPPVSVQATVTAVQHESPNDPDELRWILRDVTADLAGAEEVRAHRVQLRDLTTELAAAEERERRRIAVGIHDRVSQPLAAARMLLGRLRASLAAPAAAPTENATTAGKPAGGDGRRPHPAPRRAMLQLDELLKVLDVAIAESRSLTFELSPPILYELGLGPALKWLAEEVERRTALKARVRNPVPDLPTDVRVFLYQATRELLANVVKHAAATAASVVIRRDKDHVRLTVSDDGSGFDLRKIHRPDPRQGGFGLFSLRTRAEQIGGHLEIKSSIGAGTHVTVSVPAAGPTSPPPR